jgi:TolA-binding protein
VQSPVPPADEAAHASRDFADAMEALSRGDFSASAGKLASFASAYPRDARVEDAVYLEAIALERAGRVTDAKAAARRYLTVYPEGAHHLQAHRITGD